jgi:hypothetical protein
VSLMRTTIRSKGWDFKFQFSIGESVHIVERHINMNCDSDVMAGWAQTYRIQN